MHIVIKRLTPELIEDYLHFFDITPHSEKPDSDGCKCYCVWWCGEKQDKEVFDKHLGTREGRREYARNKIIEDKLRGYLAYCDDQVVGWCNANVKSECYECFCWQHFMGEVHKDDAAQKTKSIFCFTISPEFRGKGVASKLLERVCQDAKADGFEYIEAYPNANFLNQAEDYMGPLNMYKKAGFVEEYPTAQKVVMKKMM